MIVAMQQAGKTAETKQLLSAVVALAVLGLAGGGFAADAPAAGKSWTLATEDTELTLAVASNTLSIVKLRNPAQNWNWTPTPSPVPLPGVNGKKGDWTFVDAAETKTNGHTVSLRFTRTDPALELTSFWRVRPGVGPVEHQITVVNKTAGPIVFQGANVEAANLNLVADNPVQFFPLEEAVVGFGEGTPLPYQIVRVGSVHGIYFAYDYGCGQYKATRDPQDPLRLNCRFWVGNNVTTTIAAGETYHLPGIMIQTYKGAEDDAANHFRKWFWNYEITPSLKNNPNEPPIEICNPPGPDGQPDFLVNQAKTNDFASWGVGCLKTDFWHWDTGHARSDEIAAALHAKGIKLSMYFNGPAMVAKPDDQVALTILLNEAKKSRFDYYRSDIYMGPSYVDMRDYHSVESFKRRLEALAKIGVGWENCANGGNVRSLDVCRRMTFMTHSDSSGLIPFFVNVYHWSYLMPPIQIKNDYWVCEGNQEEGKVTVAWLRGNLLGAILTGPPTSASFRGALADIKTVFRLYNTRQRAILRGADVYRILPPPAGGEWFGLQYYNTFIDRGSVLLWQNGGPASQRIKLRGLDKGRTYQITFEDAKDKNGEMTGAQLMDEGLNVTMGPNASEIVWINCAELSANPGVLPFVVADAKDQAPAQRVSIAYRLGPGLNKAFTVTCADPWVKIERGTGAGNGQTFSVSVDPGNRPSGFYRSTITVSRPDIAERIDLPVAMRLGTPAPKVTTINPPSARCMGNGQQPFILMIRDQFGEPFAAPIQWSVSGGGKIDDQGVFRSDGSLGAFTVTATVKGYPAATATAQLKVLPVNAFNLARWKIDETNGTVVADSWGNFPGTLVGGPTWEAGKRGGALRLNGKGQYVDTQWNLEGLQLPCTFAFWVNPAATQCEYADIFGNHDGSTVGLVMQQDGAALNQYSFGYGSTPSGGSAGPVQLTANEWQHVAVVCDGETVILYLNGKEAARGTGENPITPNPKLNFRLGSGYSGGRFFNGALDDFRIYGRAFSADEVQALMKDDANKEKK